MLGCLAAFAQPAAVSGADSLSSASTYVTGRLAVGADDRAGILSAGMLCLPHGILRVRDFVSDAREFEQSLNLAISRLDAQSYADFAFANGTSLTVRLTNVDAKLCSRKYGAFGFGDRKNLSGKVLVSFEWSKVSGGNYVNGGKEDIEVITSKNSAKPLNLIFSDAIDKLVIKLQGRLKI